MQVVEIQFAPWDQTYYFKPETETGQALDLKAGEQVVVATSLGVDLGKVVAVGDLLELPKELEEIKPILRKAAAEDELKMVRLAQENEKFLKACSSSIKKHNLPMKLIDVHQSFDASRLTFAFIADGRVDFRELVKDLSRKYQKAIRLQQLGVRDEAKIMGDFGPCGRVLCCNLYLKELGNVTTDMAKDQQVAHRGSDRLSGACGRLKCCLRYEEDVYQELSASLPPLGSFYKTNQGEGLVLGWHTLKGTIDVKIETSEGTEVVEVPVKPTGHRR